ncbi:phage tail protein I [Mediterraneibacter gnavus]|uniref:phage tail protein I n=1 Tax=Mediterraneibacter gnavus TaxID=33038 RepID=UPI003562B69C
MPNQKGVRAAGNDIYTVDFAEYLPDPLKRDPKMKAFAAAVTKELLEVSGNIDKVLIYSRIDELPEELVDILAFDMHVDWYDYSYPLEVKRDILKNSVKVHKKMGTKYAIEHALGALYPQSEVEEWFEYEGEPHHFRIVCDVTSNRITASYTDIVNAVKMYKRLSSHMDEVTYQSSVCMKILTHTDCYIYKTPLTGRLTAGTYPQRNRRGAQAGSCFVVGTEAAGFIFTSPLAGTVPERNVIFRGSAVQIDAETALNAFRYTNTPAGQINAGETPQRSHRGENRSATVTVEDEAEAFLFSVPAAGTVPERNMVQRTEGGTIESTVKTEAFLHRNKMCGSKRKL